MSLLFHEQGLRDHKSNLYDPAREIAFLSFVCIGLSTSL